MQFTTIFLFSFAALGAVANPINSQADSVEVRTDNNVLITYTGTCTRAKNECKYKAQSGANAFIKCPTFANKKCTADGKPCSYDSVSKKVTCD